MSDVKVKDGVWRALLAKAHKLDKAHVKVGILKSKGGDQTDEDGSISLIELAAIHEFGSPAANIPERSFIRSTFEEKSDELDVVVGKLARAIVTNKMRVPRALALLGTWASNEIKNHVMLDTHIPPPLKEATIRAKGSDRPLVDTGRLINAVSYEVDEG